MQCPNYGRNASLCQSAGVVVSGDRDGCLRGGRRSRRRLVERAAGDGILAEGAAEDDRVNEQQARLGRQRKGEDHRRPGDAFRTVEVSDGQPGPEQGEEAEEAENTHRAQWQPREDRDTPHGLEPEGFGGHTRDAALI